MQLLFHIFPAGNLNGHSASFFQKKTATFCDGLHASYYMFRLFSKTQILRHRTAEADMQTNISVRRTPV